MSKLNCDNWKLRWMRDKLLLKDGKVQPKLSQKFQPYLNLDDAEVIKSNRCAFDRYVLHTSGFFLTSTAEKTKTQGQNSSKKLKEKTQPLGATLLQFVKTQEKNSSFSKISRGTPKYTIFITKYFQKREHFGTFLIF